MRVLAYLSSHGRVHLPLFRPQMDMLGIGQSEKPLVVDFSVPFCCTRSWLELSRIQYTFFWPVLNIQPNEREAHR